MLDDVSFFSFLLPLPSKLRMHRVTSPTRLASDCVHILSLLADCNFLLISTSKNTHGTRADILRAVATGAANHVCMLFLRVPKRTSNGAIKLKASEASPTACNADDAGFLVAQAPGRFIVV